MLTSNTTTTSALLLALLAAACTEQEPATDEAAMDTAVAAADSPMAAPTTTGFVDPNNASESDLASAGLDSAQVAALVAGRPYATMLGVDSVLQLDSMRADEVYSHVWMPLDLNSASAEEILLIPGIGNRMRHEFEEYRPYRGIEQFRREIGKYVDEAEVARLERYVTIRS
jgi:DNA uptake protein ComE-like DNA-binding protein